MLLVINNFSFEIELGREVSKFSGFTEKKKENWGDEGHVSQIVT